MIKRVSLLFIACCIGPFAGPAYADQALVEEASLAARAGSFGPYANAGVGASWLIGPAGTGLLGSFTEYSSPGFSIEVGFGYNLNPLRLELAYAFDSSSLEPNKSVAGR